MTVFIGSDYKPYSGGGNLGVNFWFFIVWFSYWRDAFNGQQWSITVQR